MRLSSSSSMLMATAHDAVVNPLKVFFGQSFRHPKCVGTRPPLLLPIVRQIELLIHWTEGRGQGRGLVAQFSARQFETQFVSLGTTVAPRTRS